MSRSLVTLVLCTALAASAEEADRKRYHRPLITRFSVAVEAGASFATQTPPDRLAGAPVYLGATVSFWPTDWFLIDAHLSHAFNNDRTVLLAGPRLRTLTLPVSANIGLRVGPIFEPGKGVRFGFSPVAGVEMIFANHVIAGLEASLDAPIGGYGPSIRVGLSLGWRF